MKKILIISISLLTIPFFGVAQIGEDFEFDGPGNGKGMKRVQEFRRTYITEMMALTPEDSAKFWPVHSEFEQKRRAIRREMKDLQKGIVAKSDAQLKEGINTMFALKEKELALEKEYTDKYLKMLSVRQVVALYTAEAQVKRELLKELQRMRGGGGGRKGGGRRF